MNFRSDAEELKNSPEFIKVAYDKFGNPIGIRPANGSEVPDEKIEKPSKPVVQSFNYDTKMIGQWLGVINQNIQILRDQISVLDNPNEKFISILQEAISKNIDFTNKQIDLINKELQNYKILTNSVFEQLNLVNENFSLLRKEISDNNLISRQLIAEMDLVKNEVRNSQNPSTEIINMLNSMNENFEILRSRVMEMNRETMQTDEQINRKLSDVASKEDLDMVISGFMSKQEFYDAKRELEELIKSNALNKNELISILIKQLKSKRKTRSKKIVKKIIKKKIRRKTKLIRKSIVRNFLMKKFGLTENERVLVITDKKMEKIGNKVYETCSKINGNTVFLVMGNMKRTGEEPEDSVVEAMKNTDVIIGITYYTLKKTDALRNAIELGARSCLMSKNFKFSVVK